MRTFRDWLYIFFLFWVLVFNVVMALLAVWLITEVGITVVEGMGIAGGWGAADGVFVKMISDGWQFYYRKKPDSEK